LESEILLREIYVIRTSHLINNTVNINKYFRKCLLLRNDIDARELRNPELRYFITIYQYSLHMIDNIVSIDNTDSIIDRVKSVKNLSFYDYLCQL